MLRDETPTESRHAAHNLLDLVDFLDINPPKWGAKAAERERNSSHWDLGCGYEGALSLAKNGWDEGVRKLQSLLSEVPTYKRNVPHYGIAGERPDVGRYVSGDPFNMVRRVKEKSYKTAVTLVFNMVASCAVGAEEIANYGAAICVLVDRLETAGVRCELFGAIVVDGLEHNHKYGLTWGIKRAEDHVDLAAVAFSFGHPAMFRRLALGAMERIPRDYENPGYGRPGKLTLDRVLTIPRDAMLIDGVGHNPRACVTIAGAMEMAKDQINAAAVKMGSDPIAELEEVA